MEIHHGDCLEVLRGMAEASVDSVVTDPPYGLSFMGKKWDYDVPSVEVWRECLRVLKPGGHLLAFAGTRTQHRMAVRIEDAGFEIRDMIAWVYGSGFPKSLNISKAIDKAAGAIGHSSKGFNAAGRGERSNGGDVFRSDHPDYVRPEPKTDAAKKWDGWGTALKPALEPITMARKPLVGTVAANVQQHGTGALNVDGCRVGTEEIKTQGGDKFPSLYGTFARCTESTHLGRWPANLIHDGSEEVVGLFPVTTSGQLKTKSKASGWSGDRGKAAWNGASGDSGSAARFFYCAKASKKDRNEGLEAFEPAATNDGRKTDIDNAYQRGTTLRANTHPTVKPTDLMRYLCRLVTPKGGVVLDPFMGSGSTGKAAVLEGFRFIGIEREAEYVAVAKARIAAAA